MYDRPFSYLISLTIMLVLLAAIQARQVQDGKSEQRGQEQNVDYFRKWLEEDVLYLITEEEKDVFRNLSSDEEREQFIEQFWFRRDSNTLTAENEFKEEHYRRIQYSNEHFTAGIPGWRTDRGRVYIMYGPPDRRERYPMGGRYERKEHEGGGVTSVFPFERWEYRYIEGIGPEVELEFVDPKGGGLYHLTMDSQEKDEFLRVPGMGLTFDEQFHPDLGGQKAWQRVAGIRPGGTGRYQGIYFEREKDRPFHKAELLAKLSRAPEIRFQDLKRVVETQIYYDSWSVGVVSHAFRVAPDRFLVPLTLRFLNREIFFEEEAEEWRSRLQVYGAISGLGGRAVYEFDDDITVTYPRALSPQELNDRDGWYQRKLLLSPGIYKLDLVVRDTVSGRIGARAIRLEVPTDRKEKLATSSLVLTRSLVPTTQDLSEPYVLGPYKVRPAVDLVFAAASSFSFYLEIYNYALDESSLLPDLQMEYAIVRTGQKQPGFQPIEQVQLVSDRIYLTREVHLKDLAPGEYDLICSISDRISGQSVVASSTFSIR